MISKRWFSGVLIFVLGFASTSLATKANAQEPREERGVLEDGLGYAMTENEIRLANMGKNVYIVMVQREPGIAPTEGPIMYIDGTMRLSTYGLSRLVAYRLEPVAIVEEGFWRPCMGADCSFIGPLPPPPPPTAPPHPSAVFLQPQGN